MFIGKSTAILPPLLSVQDRNFFMVRTAERLGDFFGMVNNMMGMLSTFPATGKDTFWQNYNHHHGVMLDRGWRRASVSIAQKYPVSALGVEAQHVWVRSSLRS